MLGPGQHLRPQDRRQLRGVQQAVGNHQVADALAGAEVV